MSPLGGDRRTGPADRRRPNPLAQGAGPSQAAHQSAPSPGRRPDELIRINLLDWRAAEREATRQRFLAALVGAAVATAAVVGVAPAVYIDHRIAAQTARNDYLHRQIAAAEQQIVAIRSLKKTRKNLIKRMRVIAALQRSRSAIVHYFDQLVATIPDGVYLTSLTQKDHTTTLDGVAESNARVSQYMVNLDASDWFTNPRLIVIQHAAKGPHRRAEFTLKVDSRNPQAPPTALAATAAARAPRS